MAQINIGITAGGNVLIEVQDDVNVKTVPMKPDEVYQLISALQNALDQALIIRRGPAILMPKMTKTDR